VLSQVFPLRIRLYFNKLPWVYSRWSYFRWKIHAKLLLNSKASDRNTRRNRGRHGRRERWKRRIRKYRTFDASLYDDGIYDLFTIEDLNYGFDRFCKKKNAKSSSSI
jgi:hypothetical protein